MHDCISHTILLLCVFCLFFFFKQKTAYEMRISDWSSDVCSSDLPTHLTPFTLVSTDTTMTGDKLDIVFEAQSDTVKVVKTYTLHNGRYDISVKNDIYNLGDKPIDPSLYLHMVRDDRDPHNASHFTHASTGTRS